MNEEKFRVNETKYPVEVWRNEPALCGMREPKKRANQIND